MSEESAEFDAQCRKERKAHEDRYEDGDEP